jgi:hypothetical protein
MTNIKNICFINMRFAFAFAYQLTDMAFHNLADIFSWLVVEPHPSVTEKRKDWNNSVSFSQLVTTNYALSLSLSLSRSLSLSLSLSLSAVSNTVRSGARDHPVSHGQLKPKCKE